MEWIEIVIVFQNEMQNLAKLAHSRKFIVIQWRLIQKMWCIGETINIFNNKLQNVLFENSFLCKSEKDQKMTHNPFTK